MKFARIISFLLPILALWSCSDDNDISQNQEYGRLGISIAIDASVSSQGANTPGTTIMVTPPEVDDFSLTLTSADSVSHRWEHFSEFPQSQRYLIGQYKAEVSSGDFREGFCKPTFTGESYFTIERGTEQQVVITGSLAQTAIAVDFTPAVIDNFPEIKAVLHSYSGSYIDYTPSNAHQLCYLNPGEGELLINLGGKYEGLFRLMKVDRFEKGVYRNIIIDYNLSTKSMTARSGNLSGEMILDETFLMSPPPVVTSEGFSSSEQLNIYEGAVPDKSVGFNIVSGSGLSSIDMTSNYLPVSHIELLGLSPAEQQLLHNSGVEVTSNGNQTSVNLTKLISLLDCPDGFDSYQYTFSLTSCNTRGKISEPQTLNVNVMAMDVKVIQIMKSMVGAAEGEIIIQAQRDFVPQNLSLFTSVDHGKSWKQSKIQECRATENDQYLVKFEIPATDRNVLVKVVYCNQTKETIEIERYQPTFSIEADAFAHRAIIFIKDKNPERVKQLTKFAHVYVNGKETPVFYRDEEMGLLVILGLESDTKYIISVTTITGLGNEENAPEVQIKTESTPELPNGNFEEIKNAFSFKNLPCGGRYSQNSVEIFNCQNEQTFNVDMPVKGWCGVNAKTFCMQSAVKNTWYMQPSTYIVPQAMSGARAVEIVTTAFDPHGEKIKDYQQIEPPYLKYSMIVPEIQYRGAGKLFLGSYKFDPATMTETYNEGIKFTSRPLSLSGFYKYIPCVLSPNDQAKVTVEVYGMDNGKEIKIGQGEARLQLAMGYTAFNVDVDYSIYRVPASRLCVMLSSSSATGTIAEETRQLRTKDDPVTASSLGSRLTVDNLILAY